MTEPAKLVLIKDLAGGLLDYWTARAQGLHAQLVQDGDALACRLHGPLGGRIYRPSANLSDHDMLALAYDVTVVPERDGFTFVPDIPEDDGPVEARMKIYHMTGLDPKVALCRAVVASSFGTAVPDAQPPLTFPPAMIRATALRNSS